MEVGRHLPSPQGEKGAALLLLINYYSVLSMLLGTGLVQVLYHTRYNTIQYKYPAGFISMQCGTMTCLLQIADKLFI